MSTKLPTISVTADKHASESASSSSTENSYSNDMDYGRYGGGGVTDVEDFDSQAEHLSKPRSRRNSHQQKQQQKLCKSTAEGDVTDVEDYDTESECEEKSAVYPELKLSLQEFLDQAIHNQEAVDNDAKESCVIKAGNFLQAQNLNGTGDYLTDCEDYDTNSEIDYGCEKSVCVDLDNAVGDQGRVNIADVSKDHNEDSDEYADVSAISDVSDLATALSNCAGADMRGMSEDELIEMSGNEEVCQMSCSDSDSEAGEARARSEYASESSKASINVAFIRISGQACRNSMSTTPITEHKNFLQIGPTCEEVLTDIEGIDDSAAEDSFDNEDINQEPIPRAVILAPGDDGSCLTDVEDFCYDDCSPTYPWPEVESVTAEALPPPHREVIELKEDKFGDTIANVMPMDNEYEFGFYNQHKDSGHTDSEEYSCVDDLASTHAAAADVLCAANLHENDIIISNELMKQQQNKRQELQTAENITDVEEIVLAGTNRRKKLKARAPSKGKLRLLDVAKAKEEGGTDIEDMELSECGLPPNVKRVEQLKPHSQLKANNRASDVEDLTADDVSDVSEFSEASNNFKACHAVKSRENDGRAYNKSKLQPLNLRLLKDDVISQQNTDVEDVQLPSDTEDINEPPIKAIPNNNCKELNDMLNESYTVVHEKSSSSFNIDAEKLHIKGMPHDAHTDIEYVESDESAARGGK